MKILLINVIYNSTTGAGAETIMTAMCEGLKQRGHEIHVLAFTDEKAFKKNINGIIVRCIPIPNLYLPNTNRQPFIKRQLWHLLDIYNPFSAKAASRYINLIKPNVIVAHNIHGWSPSIWNVAYNSKIPLVQVLHDQYLLCPTSMFKNGKVCKTQCKTCAISRWPHKRLSNKVTAVVGVSNFILNKFLAFGYFKETPIKTTIHNAIPTPTGGYKPRKLDSKIHFGFLGRLVQLKGLETLLKAYLQIKNENTMLYIAGSGDSNYVEYLKRMYADDSIIYMGKVDKSKFFEQVDLTIVPSICEEALGMVGIESLLYGIPIILSQIGGLPELVIENKNGFLFKPNDENELATKMLEFSKNISFYKNSYKDIQQSAERFLNFRGWIDTWEKLLKSIAIKII